MVNKKKANAGGKVALDTAKKAVILKVAIFLAPWVAGLLLIVVGIPVALGVFLGGTGGIVGQAAVHAAQSCPGSAPANQQVGYNTSKPAPATTPAMIVTGITPATPATDAAVGPAAPAAPATAMPYPLPAAHGFTGSEEAVNEAGHVASTGGAVTWANFASVGQPYRDYYITMRWNYGAWNWDGTATDIDQDQYNWMAAGNNGKPWLVLVTNPRTHSSIIAAVIEAGPGPWVGVVSYTQRSIENGPANGWPNPTRGTPDGYRGIVSGFPPVALQALGDASGPAQTGYPGQTGDDLTYRWAADQTATPGPTGEAATRVSSSTGACVNVTNGTSSCNATGIPGSGASPASTAPTGAAGDVAAQWCTATTGVGGGGGGVVVNGVKVTIPDRPDVPAEIRGKTIDAPSAAVAKGIAAGFATIGMPYVWGGGTDGGGPDQGCARAGTDLNACQGIVGFDCSGLTGYVLAQAGFSIPGNSSGQRSSGVSVPQSAAIAGDIIGYEGHVAVFLGTVDGVQYMLEAPDVGSNIHIRAARWSGADSDVHRYWGAVV